MSGIIGHTIYAVLAAKAARQRKLPVTAVIDRHFASYLCGSYLGCDIQTLPEAFCVETGQEVGYGTAPLEKSPITGGPVKPWKLAFEGAEYTPRDIHHLFYGRSHLVFGWQVEDRQLMIPWDHLPDYLSLIVEDAFELFGPGERKLAYLFGWMAHIVGDSLIKSVQPGVTLDLLGGKYTPANRPIQDLVTFHEIGRKEFQLDWAALLADLAETPVEAIQPHYMRAARPQGMLALQFADGWRPDLEPLLRRVLAENRRYQQLRNPRLLKQMALTRTKDGWQCDRELSRTTGGLSYAEMVKLADKANFRHALWEMGEAIVTLFEQVIERQPKLQELPLSSGPGWDEITARWRIR